MSFVTNKKRVVCRYTITAVDSRHFHLLIIFYVYELLFFCISLKQIQLDWENLKIWQIWHLNSSNYQSKAGQLTTFIFPPKVVTADLSLLLYIYFPSFYFQLTLASIVVFLFIFFISLLICWIYSHETRFKIPFRGIFSLS